MHQDRENLDIIFRKRPPEQILKKILAELAGENGKEYPYEISSFEMYDYIGGSSLQGYSGDEIRLRFNEVNESCKETEHSIYGLLYKYADQVLFLMDRVPCCRIEKVLDWRSMTMRLGQDLFVTAWLARNNVRARDMNQTKNFDWPYAIQTNDERLNKLLEKGIAENHFHLGGSTQSFSISWAALMNHPNKIYKTVHEGKRFRRDLVDGRTEFSKDNESRWVKLLSIAAAIRAFLFQRCIGDIKVEDFRGKISKFLFPDDNYDLELEVELIREEYGAKTCLKGYPVCLDYAMCSQLYSVDLDSSNRLLAAERAFLYRCFYNVYREEFSYFELTVFYLYLLIKSNFRGELIQINQRNGFYNFLQYQDRKEQFYPFLEYSYEAQRLAVCSTIQDNHVSSLEARIMPATNFREMASKIIKLDDKVKCVSEEECDKLFYVTHFAKRPFDIKEFEENGYVYTRPRNYKVRKLIYQQAKAIYLFRKHYHHEGLTDRIHGIDACSSEIGCRPETFATEFRFLRHEGNGRREHAEEDQNDLRVTYHVGEDFLDICDGLRAVDEAVSFLHLGNGDRIGHGLVLGLNPDSYYKERYHCVYLTKQDYLDNCLWILFRTLEWNIPLESTAREILRQEANRMAFEIYGSVEQGQCLDILEALYRSWHLRGDHPSLYNAKGECEVESPFDANVYNRYRKCSEVNDAYRKDEAVAKLYYRYHYDENVKKNGLKVIPVEIKEWYVKLMADIQEYMRTHIIAKKGICIECNPSSNKLIGYFQRYDQHPIVLFNDYMLNPQSNKAQIMVSINTDDLGVFDTSLSNEYAMVLESLRRKRHSEGKYNDEQIYSYLEYIRENGLKMKF